MMRIPLICLGVALLCSSSAMAQPAQPAKMPAPSKIVMHDQNEKSVDLAVYRGQVVVMVYGDRKASEECRAIGEKLHVYWHPLAKGLTGAKAQAAPTEYLPGLQPGEIAPNIHVIPVACCGKVPYPIRGMIRSQIAKSASDLPVWIDFSDTMKDSFGLRSSAPNIVVFDVKNRPRLLISGNIDEPTMNRLAETVQDLRFEAVRGR
jgi:hypothetical protein